MGSVVRARCTVAWLDPTAWAIWRIDMPSACNCRAVPIWPAVRDLPRPLGVNVRRELVLTLCSRAIRHRRPRDAVLGGKFLRRRPGGELAGQVLLDLGREAADHRGLPYGGLPQHIRRRQHAGFRNRNLVLAQSRAPTP